MMYRQIPNTTKISKRDSIILLEAFEEARRTDQDSLRAKIFNSFLRFISFATKDSSIYPYWDSKDGTYFPDLFITHGYLGHELIPFVKKYKSKFWDYMAQYEPIVSLNLYEKIEVNSFLLDCLLYNRSFNLTDIRFPVKESVLNFAKLESEYIDILMEENFWNYLQKTLEEIEIYLKNNKRAFLPLHGYVMIDADSCNYFRTIEYNIRILFREYELLMKNKS